MENLKRFMSVKKRIVFVVVILLAISLPFVVSQVLKRQDLRQRAATAPAITFALSPSTKTLGVGEALSIELIMNAGQNDIGTLYYVLTYDPTKFQFIGGLNGTGLMVANKSGQEGNLTFKFTNPSLTPIIGNNLRIHTLQLKALSPGITQVTVEDSIRPTATGYDTFVPVENAANINGTYTITNNDPTATPIISTATATNTPSPTSDVCVAPTGLWPNGCSCTLDSQCLGQKCKLDGNGGGTCTDYMSPTPTNTPTPTPTLAPTATSVPTATIPIGGTGIQIIASVPGIGLGDGENHQPLHPDRIITVILSNFTTKAQIGSPIQSSLTYDSTSGKFKGTVNFGASFTTDVYDVKIKMDNTLYKKQQGITVTAGITTNQFPATFTLVPSDLDQDNRISISDYTIESACVNEPILPACTPNYVPLADVNDNGTNDVLDMVILQRGFSTPIEGD